MPWFHNSTRERTKKIGEGNCHRSSKLNFPVISYAHFKRSEVKDPPTLLQPYIITCAKAAEKLSNYGVMLESREGSTAAASQSFQFLNFFCSFPPPYLHRTRMNPSKVPGDGFATTIKFKGSLSKRDISARERRNKRDKYEVEVTWGLMEDGKLLVVIISVQSDSKEWNEIAEKEVPIHFFFALRCNKTLSFSLCLPNTTLESPSLMYWISSCIHHAT